MCRTIKYINTHAYVFINTHAYANTSDKETSFLDLNIKVIGSGIHTSVYDKRDDFGFPIVNFPWLRGDVPRLPSKLLQNYLHRVTDITHFEKYLESSLDHTPYCYRNFYDISFQEYVTMGISHPVFCGDLVYKLRRVKDTPNFISSGSKIVKRL